MFTKIVQEKAVARFAKNTYRCLAERYNTPPTIALQRAYLNVIYLQMNIMFSVDLYCHEYCFNRYMRNCKSRQIPFLGDKLIIN